MKKLATVFAAALFLSAHSTAGSSAQTAGSFIVQFEQKEKKKKIKLMELPSNIVAILNGKEYAGWEAKKAWKINRSEGMSYEVKIKKGNKTKKVKFDHEGREFPRM